MLMTIEPNTMTSMPWNGPYTIANTAGQQIKTKTEDRAPAAADASGRGRGPAATLLYEEWGTGTLEAEIIDLHHRMPEVKILQSAVPMLTDRMQLTINRLLAMMQYQAQRKAVSVKAIVISGFVDPEEDSRKVIVTQRVDLPAQAALDYWDKLGIAIESLYAYMPDILAQILIERVSVQVEWNIDNTAV